MTTSAEIIVKKKLLPKRTTRILISLIVLISFLSVLLVALGIPDTAKILNPELASKAQIMLTTSLPVLIVIPIGSFILSSLLSLIPYKDFSYSQKFFPFGLFILFAMEILILGLLLSDFIK